MALCHVWCKLAQWFLRLVCWLFCVLRRIVNIFQPFYGGGSWKENLLNFVSVFLYLVIVSPWKRVGPSFVWNWIPFSQGGFVPSLIEVGLVVLENKIFKYRQSILAIWLSSPPLENGFIWKKKLNPLYPKRLCAKFDSEWPSGSWEEGFFFIFLNVFSLFGYYLPLEKRMALHLNKLQFPTPKYDLCPFWLKLVQWFWRSGKIEKFTDR